MTRSNKGAAICFWPRDLLECQPAPKRPLGRRSTTDSRLPILHCLLHRHSRHRQLAVVSITGQSIPQQPPSSPGIHDASHAGELTTNLATPRTERGLIGNATQDGPFATRRPSCAWSRPCWPHRRRMGIGKNLPQQGTSTPVIKLSLRIAETSMSPSLTQPPPEVWFADHSEDCHNLLGWLSHGDTQYDK